MKVIAGRYKNKQIVAGNLIRPTSGLVKEAIFNIIMHNNLPVSIEGAVILDLFCGSAALGIEAISRGAKKLVAIDSDTRLAHKNTASIQEECLIIRGDLSRKPCPMSMIPSDTKFDIVFIDPPYDNAQLLVIALQKIASTSNHLFHEGTILVLEMPTRTSIHDVISQAESENNSLWRYLLIKEKIYNKIAVVLLRFEKA